MSYWSHNPELLDEIIFDRMVAKGLASPEDDPFEVVQEFIKKPGSHNLIAEAESDYWAGLADAAEAQQDWKEDK